MMPKYKKGSDKKDSDKKGSDKKGTNDEIEIIVLNHFQNRTYSKYDIYFPSPYKLDEESEKLRKKDKELRKKEKKKGLKSYGLNFEPKYIKDEEIEKDNINKTELFLKNSLNNYYKIEKLEIFKKSNLKVQLKDIHILSNEKLFTFENIKDETQLNFINYPKNNMMNNMMNINMNNNMNIYNLGINKEFKNNMMINNEQVTQSKTKPKIKIYENHNFSLLNEIEFEDNLWKEMNGAILSVIELDNKDLIVSSCGVYDIKNQNIIFIIIIFQYQNKNYILHQTIKEKIDNKIKSEKKLLSYQEIDL